MNGAAVTSGVAWDLTTVEGGSATATFVVMAQDGVTQKTYTVAVARAASTVSTLSGLVTSSGTLSPTFVAGTLTYSLAIANSVASVRFTPTATHGGAALTVNSVAVASGQASGLLVVAEGATMNVPVVVTAQDGVSKTTYTVAVSRASSDNALLGSLSVSGGTLSPAFSASSLSYTMAVINSVCLLYTSDAADD